MNSRMLFACLFLAGLAGCGRKGEPEPIIIGHVAPLSGVDKARGEQAKQGIALAVEEANAESNRVLGRRVIVTHADTRSDPAEVRPVMKRLLAIDRVCALLGGPEAAALENIGSIAQPANVPFLLAGSPLAPPSGDFVFFTGLTPAAQGKALGQLASAEWPTGKFGIIHDGTHDALVTAFTQAVGKEAVAGSWIYAGAEKLPALAKDVAVKKLAAVLFAGKPADAIEWAQSASVSRLPVLVADYADTVAALQAASLTSVVYLTTPFAAGDDMPAAKEFSGKFQERYGAPPTAAAALAYDDARIVFEAIRRAKSIEGPTIRKELAELHFDGVTGPIAFDKQQSATRTVYIMKLTEGKLRIHKGYPLTSDP